MKPCRMSSAYCPLRPGAQEKATPGGAAPPQGLSSRASAQKYPGFGLARLWIKHRGPGLVHEQLAGSLQIGNQRGKHRLQLIGGLADPSRESGAVQIDALTAVNLRLAVKWQVIGVQVAYAAPLGPRSPSLADQHMGHGGLGWHAAGDQARGCRCLDDAV